MHVGRFMHEKNPDSSGNPANAIIRRRKNLYILCQFYQLAAILMLRSTLLLLSIVVSIEA